MGDDRPIVYAEDDRIVYRASSLGGAIHALSACRLGFDPLPWPARTKRYMEEGNLHEPDILAKLNSEYGWKIRGDLKQQVVELGIGTRVLIRGAMDGIAHKPTPDKLLERFVEAKAVSQDVADRYDREGPFKSNYRYAVQFSVYGYGSGLPGLFAYKNRNSGEVHVIEYDDMPVSLPTIRAIPVRVEQAARKGELLDEAKYHCTDYPCRWYHLHAERTEPIVSNELIDTLATSYDRARAKETEAKSAKADLKTRLLEALGDKDGCKTSSWSVRRVTQNRPRFDTHKAEAEVPDIVARYTVENIIETIRVDQMEEK